MPGEFLDESEKFVHTFWTEVAHLANLGAQTPGVDVASDIAEKLAAGARRLMGADGACIVFREGEQVHYVKEDAVAPLWAGQRFPLSNCISGWSISNEAAVVIEDIYKDSRIPIEYYKPTFVRSLVMQPVARTKPFGAIGVYWAKQYAPPSKALIFLQALADLAALALLTAQLRQAFSP